MSARFPSASSPTRSDQPINSAAFMVELRMMSMLGMPSSDSTRAESVTSNRAESGILVGMSIDPDMGVSHEALRLIAEIDEFRGGA